MKKVQLLSLLFAALISFNSCKKEDKPADNSTAIPYLKVGNKWVYNLSGFTAYSTMTTEITAENNGVYTMATKLDNETGLTEFLYGQNGYLNDFQEGEKKGADQYLLKYLNIKVGDKWTRVTPTDTYYHECVSINETVTVPAGTFVCKKIHITFKNAFNEQDTYWNDEYGQIKVENLILNTELAGKNF